MEDKHILHGPKLPCSTESLGVQLYNSLIKFQLLPALIDDTSHDVVVSFKELLRTSCCLAETLKANGYTKKDVIGISSENSIHCFTPLLASLFLGCTVTLYNPNYTAGEVFHLVNVSRPSVIFCSATSLKTLAAVQNKMKQLLELVVIGSTENQNGVKSLKNYIPQNIWSSTDPTTFRPVAVDSVESVAFILFSSGTTGMPKGVMLTHWNTNSALAIFWEPSYYSAKKSSQQSALFLMPIFHIFSLIIQLYYLLDGHTSIVLNKFEPLKFLKIVEKFRVPRLFIVPPIAAALINAASQSYDLSSVEHIVSGASPLSLKAEEDLQRVFPNCKSNHRMYGMTEILAGTAFKLLENKPGSIGKVAPNMSGKVVDREGRSLGAGFTGELCFKGDGVMKGYSNDEKSTKLALRNGWMFTGDIGHYDEDGYWYITGRIKELIKYKGYQVAPAQLESVILTHSDVIDAAVLGIPHKNDGELPCAFVVKKPKSTVTAEEIKAVVAENLSAEKWLRGGAIFVPSIPRSPSGKILRENLRRQFFPVSRL